MYNQSSYIDHKKMVHHSKIFIYTLVINAPTYDKVIIIQFVA